MRNKYKLILVQNHADSTLYIINSKDNPNFFRTIRNGSVYEYYTIIGKIITVYEEDLEKAQDEIYNIAGMIIPNTEKRILVCKVWLNYDCRCKRFSLKKKDEILNYYAIHYLNGDIF